MAGSLVDIVVPGRHSRRMMLAGVHRMSLAALLMLVAQYGLGIVLNLYVTVPAADQHAGIMQDIANGPVTLTLHALLGLALIGTAIVLLARAVSVGDRMIAVLAATGLTAIGGAFAAGEIFVRNGQQFASAAMAILTAVALLCYIGTLTVAGAAYRQVAHARTRPVAAVQPDPDDDLDERGNPGADYDGSGPAWPPEPGMDGHPGPGWAPEPGMDDDTGPAWPPEPDAPVGRPTWPPVGRSW